MSTASSPMKEPTLSQLKEKSSFSLKAPRSSSGTSSSIRLSRLIITATKSRRTRSAKDHHAQQNEDRSSHLLSGLLHHQRTKHPQNYSRRRPRRPSAVDL